LPVVHRILLGDDLHEYQPAAFVNEPD
jgi:hypothetical protein